MKMGLLLMKRVMHQLYQELVDFGHESTCGSLLNDHVVSLLPRQLTMANKSIHKTPPSQPHRIDAVFHHTHLIYVPAQYFRRLNRFRNIALVRSINHAVVISNSFINSQHFSIPDVSLRLIGNSSSERLQNIAQSSTSSSRGI